MSGNGSKAAVAASRQTARQWAVLCAAALVALAFAGCRGAQTVDERAPAADLRPAALVVLPVHLAVSDTTTTAEIALKTLAVTNQLLNKTDIPLLGLYDFALLKPQEDVAVVAYDTDLPAHSDVGDLWQNAVAVKVTVSENRATHVRDITDLRTQAGQKAKVLRQHGVEALLHVEAALVDVRRGTQIAWTTVDVADDPLDSQVGDDPRPGVTRAIASAVTRLLELGEGQFSTTKGRRLRGGGFADSALAVAQWKTADSWSLLDAQRDQSSEIRDGLLLALTDRIQPDLSPSMALSVARHRGVLVVTGQAPLLAGDVVTAIEDKPVVAVHQLDRHLQACADRAGGCRVQVLRGGASLNLQVRWPAVPAVTTGS